MFIHSFFILMGQTVPSSVAHYKFIADLNLKSHYISHTFVSKSPILNFSKSAQPH